MDDSPVEAAARRLVQADRELAIDLTAYLHSARVLEEAGSAMGARLRSFQAALRRALAAADAGDSSPAANEL